MSFLFVLPREAIVRVHCEGTPPETRSEFRSSSRRAMRSPRVRQIRESYGRQRRVFVGQPALVEVSQARPAVHVRVASDDRSEILWDRCQIRAPAPVKEVVLTLADRVRVEPTPELLVDHRLLRDGLEQTHAEAIIADILFRWQARRSWLSAYKRTCPSTFRVAGRSFE